MNATTSFGASLASASDVRKNAHAPSPITTSPAAVGHALLQASTGLFFEPTLFASETTPRAWLDRSVTHAALTVDNLHAVALASGSVPLYMEPIAIDLRAERGARDLP